MPASGAVHVARLVPGARVPAGAGVGVLGVDGDDVVVHVVAVGVVQVTVVEEVEVPLVHDGLVPAAGSVDVRVLAVVGRVLGHVPTVRADAGGGPGAADGTHSHRCDHRPAGWRTLKPRRRAASDLPAAAGLALPRRVEAQPATIM